MDKLRINFVLPALPHVSGGPLAILEYANRLAARGHTVSVTTDPDNRWEGDNPFPWFKIDGEVRYRRLRAAGTPRSFPDVERTIAETVTGAADPAPFQQTEQQLSRWLHVMDAIPECDINIATLWSTAFPVYYSRRGKPVFFMQHWEEVFFERHDDVFRRLLARTAISLPLYKIANSSWLQDVLEKRIGQRVPYSTNAIDQADFAPRRKLSAEDGVLRVVTYSRPEAWKGFADAVAAMQRVRQAFEGRVEWLVFGYKHLSLEPGNAYAPYTYHPKLSFKELAALYASADVALCPSWYESFPLPPLEAMASGTPPVTTAVGVEDYARDGVNALVTPPRDAAAMAQAVLRLLRDAPLRADLAQAGLETAAQFTWERAVEAREKLLFDIHRDEVGYDRWAATGLGLVDGGGAPFERAPADALPDGEGLYWDEGRLLLLAGGVRRYVQEPRLVPLLLERGWMFVEPDPLDQARIPYGPPIGTQAEVPFADPARTQGLRLQAPRPRSEGQLA